MSPSLYFRDLLILTIAIAALKSGVYCKQCVKEGTVPALKQGLQTPDYDKVAKGVQGFDQNGLIDEEDLLEKHQLTSLFFSNEAIDDLLDQQGTNYDEFLKKDQKKALKLWRQHAIRDQVLLPDDLEDGQVLQAFSGPLTVSKTGDTIKFTSESGVSATVSDCIYFDGKNQFIPIDNVLIPKDFEF